MGGPLSSQCVHHNDLQSAWVGLLSSQCVDHNDLQSTWVGLFLVSVSTTMTCSLHEWVTLSSQCIHHNDLQTAWVGPLSCQCVHHNDLQSVRGSSFWTVFYLAMVTVPACVHPLSLFRTASRRLDSLAYIVSLTNAYSQYFVNDIEHTENEHCQKCKVSHFLSHEPSTSTWFSLSYR